MFTLPWFKKKTTQPTEAIKVGDVYFWQQQDGTVERELATRLSGGPAFKCVSEAYLMRVRYPGSVTEQVALCLVADASHHQQIVEEVGKTFRRMFKPSECMDILFLTEDQQERIVEVGRAFYRKDVAC